MAKREKISEERRNFLKEFINQNNITSAKDIEEALKDMFKDKYINFTCIGLK